MAPVERALRAVLGDRMTRGASDERDATLAVVIEQCQRVERAGWFSGDTSGAA